MDFDNELKKIIKKINYLNMRMDQIISCLYGNVNCCGLPGPTPFTFSAVLLSSISWSYLYIRNSIRSFKLSYENVELWVVSFINSFRWSASVRHNDWKNQNPKRTDWIWILVTFKVNRDSIYLYIGLKYINSSYSVPKLFFPSHLDNFLKKIYLRVI